ncbi:hypothetical protein SO802_022951 [Lithocarpus litseifolius]|uniref:Fe2OG dioxygenase domain-containing protein n=1 Tax=Lithocarpus litseifolius TaxID=425828 RepID=A0AAW2C5M5_9ROSI
MSREAWPLPPTPSAIDCPESVCWEANVEYAKHLHGVVDKLFKSLSLGLGLEGHELKEAAGGDNLEYLLKINYYPPCPRPDLALVVVAHTDMSTITILVPNDVQGLQASRDGRWYDVKYIPNALVIHIRDQIELWYLNIGSQKDDQGATSALLDLVTENHVASTHLVNRATSRSEIVYLI